MEETKGSSICSKRKTSKRGQLLSKVDTNGLQRMENTHAHTHEHTNIERKFTKGQQQAEKESGTDGSKDRERDLHSKAPE